MRTNKIVYIGNHLRGSNRNVTTIETLSAQLRSLGCRVHLFSSKKNKVLRLLHMLWGVLQHGRGADLVLIDTYSTQNFFYAVAVGNLCRIIGLPYVPILHGGNLPVRLKKNKAVSYKLFHGAKTNVAPSRYLLDAFASEGYKNLTYIPNTIEIKDYSFLLRNAIKPKILWVRAFAEIYNPMLAIRALETLLNDFPNATLCMVGPDKDGSLISCRQYAEAKNLPVSFTGKLSKKEWRTKSEDFDIFLNTTNFDNTPVSVMEAMALGLPVVSTDVGGIPHLISNKVNGLLVQPNHGAAIARAVKKLHDDPMLTESLSKNARRKVEEFDWEIVKQHWLTLLRQ